MKQATKLNQVICLAIGFGIFTCSVIRLTGSVLDRGIQIEFMGIIFRKEGEIHPTAVDIMIGLFGDIGFVGRQTE